MRLLNGGDFAAPSSAGRLQEELTGLLSACPNGVAVLQAADRISLPGLGVLSNALSESGNLQQNGRSVSSSGALYIIVSEWGADPAADDYEAAVKAALEAAMKSAHEAAEEAQSKLIAGQASAITRALRRRIDFVAPVVNDFVPEPAPEDQVETAALPVDTPEEPVKVGAEGEVAGAAAAA